MFALLADVHITGLPALLIILLLLAAIVLGFMTMARAAGRGVRRLGGHHRE
jgi:hypothetical protein